MDRTEFDKIKTKTSSFKYSSFNYIRFDTIKSYDLLANNDDLVLMLGYNREANIHEYIWAANDVNSLMCSLKHNDKYILSFVPKEWVSELSSNGMQIRNAWHDYYIYDLDIKNFNSNHEYDLLKTSEMNAASEITLQCKGQSRGFTGQSPEWFIEWLNSTDIKDTAVLVNRRNDDKITGLVCVGLYGHDSSNGPIVWIREAAVSPAFQGKGIGRNLISNALVYGKQRGAKKAFLAVDEDNTNAIGLYKSLGFKASKEDSEITMMN